MAKFIYRMQNILNLKLKLEEQQKMEFAAARKRLDEEEEKLELLFNRKAGYEEEGRRLREDSLNVQDIRDNRNAILQMDEYIAYQKVQVSKAEAELEKERQKLKEAMQERKIQEKLRENAFEAFMKEENAREGKEVDELVSYTYGQKRKVKEMAGTEVITDTDAKSDKKSVAEEKKRLKAEKKEQKKEAKRRAKELALQEAELDDDEVGGGIPVFLVTGLIVVVWIAILCLLVKLDVGGFGSGVLAPILKDVPVISKILPASEEEPISADTEGEAVAENPEEEAYGGYTDLKEAVNYIKELELELQRAQSTGAANSEELESLKAEVARLKTFEDNQVEFQRIKTEFYEEVIYAENGPGAEAYKKYFESIDPATAEYLYKQVVQQVEESAEVEEYARAYSEMKPKAAAAIIEAMTDNLGLASRILSVMSPEDRGKILEAMDPQVAARITKIMDPES